MLFTAFPLAIPSRNQYAHVQPRQSGEYDMDIDDDSVSLRLTTPGEVISDSSNVLRLIAVSFQVGLMLMICERGHGTYIENEEVVASLAGVVSRVNKLVTVKPLKSRPDSFCEAFLGLTHLQVYSRSW